MVEIRFARPGSGAYDDLAGRAERFTVFRTPVTTASVGDLRSPLDITGSLRNSGCAVQISAIVETLSARGLPVLISMQRYIAFLSGLPTGPKTVSQDALKSLFIKLGFLNVETHGTTGNVAFETSPVGVVSALEAQISRHLERAISGDIRIFIRTPAELAAIEADLPFGEESEGSSVFIVLLAESLDERTERKLRVRRTAADVLHPRGREIYWLRQVGDGGGSPLVLSGFIDTPATLRSLTTIKSLLEKYSPPGRRTQGDITESARSRL